MALTPALAVSSYSKTDDGSVTNLVDNTVYGTPNADRADLALWVTAYKVDENLVESALTVQTFDPETATTFIVENTIDGHYKVYLAIVEDYDNGNTYEQYDVVWYSSTEAFYRCKVASSTGVIPTNTTNWEVIADPTTLIANDGTASESVNLTWQILQFIVTFNSQVCMGNLVVSQDDCGCSSDTRTDKAIKELEQLIRGMLIADGRQLYTKGEKYARIATNICNDCSC